MSHNNIHKIRKLIDEDLVLYPNYILKFLNSKVLEGNFSNDLVEEEELLIINFLECIQGRELEKLLLLTKSCCLLRDFG